MCTQVTEYLIQIYLYFTDQKWFVANHYYHVKYSMKSSLTNITYLRYLSHMRFQIIDTIVSRHNVNEIRKYFIQYVHT